MKSFRKSPCCCHCEMSLFGPNSVFNINRGSGPLGYGVVHPVPSQHLKLYSVCRYYSFWILLFSILTSIFTQWYLRWDLLTFPQRTKAVSLTWSTPRMNPSWLSWQQLGPWPASSFIRQSWTQAGRGGGGELGVVTNWWGRSGGIFWNLLQIPWRKQSGECNNVSILTGLSREEHKICEIPRCPNISISHPGQSIYFK